MSTYPSLPPREPIQPVYLPSWYDPANREKTTEDSAPLPPLGACPRCGMWRVHQSKCPYVGLSIDEAWKKYKEEQGKHEEEEEEEEEN